MKLFKTKVKTDEYRYLDNIITKVYTTKYFLGFKIKQHVESTRKPIPPITSIKRKNYRFGEVELKVGMRVINRSNEPDDLMICEIIGFDDMNGKVSGGGEAFPLIRDEKDGKEYMTMGIVLPYSEELMEKLKGLEPIEQYNYLVYPTGQIKEKYGVKYKTFE